MELLAYFQQGLPMRTTLGHLPGAKGTSVHVYYLGPDDFVGIIFENVGSPSCTDHAKHTEDKEKSYRNAADALLERFYNSTGSFETAKGYCVIIVIVFGAYKFCQFCQSMLITQALI